MLIQFDKYITIMLILFDIITYFVMLFRRDTYNSA
jgi:hypothetical protein